MEIMKLIPTGKDYLWGGTRLREEYGKKIDLTPLAETWECSVHPDGPSYVANGIYKGQTLAEVLNAHSEYLGTKVENGELPVLVKFIDAKKDLSVQVHPDDVYAREHEGDNGKTEMWYVIDADEGASLIYGFQHEVTEEILRKAVDTGTLDKHLQKIQVHKGDTYFVPAGTVHGIGKGILLAEIQESSNVTYRVYDYNRVDKNGKKRELHFDKAVQVMEMKVTSNVNKKSRMVKYYPGCSRELLCRCKYFETERMPDKTFHYVASYMLKGYAMEKNGIAEKYGATSYKSLKRKIPSLLDILDNAYGKSYCQISNPTLVNNEVDLGITNANKGKSRAITHSFGIKLRALMLGEEVEITFCDVQGTKKIYKFTEVERMSFVLFGILYISFIIP